MEDRGPQSAQGRLDIARQSRIQVADPNLAMRGAAPGSGAWHPKWV